MNSTPRPLPATSHPQSHNSPSPRIGDTLKAIAPSAASALSHFFPFPHQSLLRLSRGRLHVVALLVFSGAPTSAIQTAARCGTWSELTAELPRLAGTKTLFENFPLPVWAEEHYKLLAAALESEHGRQMLLQLRPTSPRDLSRHAELSWQIGSGRIAQYVHSEQESLLLRQIIDLVDAEAPEDTPSFLADLSAAPTERAFWNRALAAMEQHAPAAPELPFELPPHYRAVRQVSSARTLARSFSNCLASMFDKVMIGQSSVFVREGTPDVMIELKALVDGRFYLSRCLLARNEVPSPALRNDVADELRRAGKGIVLAHTAPEASTGLVETLDAYRHGLRDGIGRQCRARNVLQALELMNACRELRSA